MDHHERRSVESERRDGAGSKKRRHADHNAVVMGGGETKRREEHGVVRERRLTGELVATSSVEKAFASHERALSKANAYVKERCADEIDALQKAQARLDRKLKDVTASPQMTALEDVVYDCDQHVQREVRTAHRELQRTIDGIQDDVGLDASERSRRLHQLTEQVETEYTRLSTAYPATTRAQMLRSLGGVRLALM